MENRPPSPEAPTVVLPNVAAFARPATTGLAPDRAYADPPFPHFKAALATPVLRLAFQPTKRDVDGLSVCREKFITATQLAAVGRTPGAYYVARLAVAAPIPLDAPVMRKTGSFMGSNPRSRAIPTCVCDTSPLPSAVWRYRVRPAVERARAGVGHLVKIELEVDTLAQLQEAMALGVDAVLLDNMGPDMLRQAVEIVAGRAITEASGRIRPDTAPAIAASGVDLLSVGWLTHSVTVLDIGLDHRG